MDQSRYVIGIDLGTTNSSVAYIDTDVARNPRLFPQNFRIPQLISPGIVEPKLMLPSFLYIPGDDEFPKGAVKLPWKADASQVVGTLAKEQGGKVPTRLVQSAKSWLCNSAASRREKILPHEAADVSQRVSPVEASASYLRHIREAWNWLMAKGDISSEFDQQEVVLTVPASFDEVARALTVEAAKLAGFVHVTLLEEPQAAFYSWISDHEESWQQLLQAGNSILVCDIGGGTTDFSLIEVVESKEQLAFRRMAVGNHLLLGGDNMDAALCHCLEKKLGNPLGTEQWLQLRHQARAAKEALLAPNQQEEASFSVILQGKGASVVGGSQCIEFSRKEMEKLLLEGFFAGCDFEEAAQLGRSSGIRTMGLPYESEPSIVKHLAKFLHQASSEEGFKRPDYLLFNGGSMKPVKFQKAIIEALVGWFGGEPPKVLSPSSLDIAVSRGAAYFGKARRGLGVRIGGGTARGYYLGVDVKDKDESIVHKALTLLPRGSEEGMRYESEQIFSLMPNAPVSFALYSSNTRLHDHSGDLLTIEPEAMLPLPPIHTVLRYGKKQLNELQEKIPVRLGIHLTQLGTLELWLKSQKTNHQWSLEFQLRTVSGQDNSLSTLGKSIKDRTLDVEGLNEAKRAIVEFFDNPQKSSKLMNKLEETLEMPRQEWSPSVLRGLFEVVLEQASKRKSTADLEARWWNLAGFLLRPGVGCPLDDFRIKELWKIILSDFKQAKSPEGQIQRWICYRRIAAGLSKGQQIQLANEILPTLFTKQGGTIEVKTKAQLYEYSEKIRALSSMELLECALKKRVGNALVQRIKSGEGGIWDYWALARIGARHLVYGSMTNVVPAADALHWVDALLMNSEALEQDQLMFVCEQLARKTEHREINVSQSGIDKIIKFFEKHRSSDRLSQLLNQATALTQQEQEQVFGDQLPAGLMLET